MITDQQLIRQHHRESRKIALQIARDMRPPTTYNNSAMGQSIPTTPHYDLLKEAELIYQWLIKD